MRKVIQLFAILVFIQTPKTFYAQTNLAGAYQDTGYFFHPSLPRDIAVSKGVTQIDSNTYQTYLGDLDGYYFQFDIDSNNNLMNWVMISGLSTNSASGFMTTDNPGGFTYPAPIQPGNSPWINTTYNNTYDSATKTFYLHYGYNPDMPGDDSIYSRQIYEKLVFVRPAAIVTSFTPTTGTAETTISIKGKYFTNTNTVTFGGKYVDTFTVISDSEIIAVVGAGASGSVEVTNYLGRGTLAGFTYIPVVAPDTGWVSAGNAGFSFGPVKTVSLALNSKDQPYVVFSDSIYGRKARVMKLSSADKWINVGDFVSDGACSNTNIIFDNDDIPYAAFIDSLYSNNITVKKYVDGIWKTVGNSGFAPCENIYSGNNVSIAIDGNNEASVLSAVYNNSIGKYLISIFHYNGSDWLQTGNTDVGISTSFIGNASFAIDKKTNIPYVVAEDYNGLVYPQLIVKKFTGAWVTVGQPHFTSGTYGSYFPDMLIDSAGTPVVCLQEDNGREQASIYKFVDTGWLAVNPRFFTPGHALYPSLAINRSNLPFIIFEDYYYNEQGTVMKYDTSNNGSWSLLGARGFVPTFRLTQNALVVNHTGIPYIAFADKTKGNKATVLHYNNGVLAVSINNFTAKLQRNDVLLNWQTSSETNTDRFDIMRSIDAIHFVKIGSINAMDNHSILNNYNYTDLNVASLLRSGFIYYKLQTVDKEGHFFEGKIIPVDIGSNKITIVLYPNPAKELLNVLLNSSNDDVLAIVILDMHGRSVIKKQKHITAGNNIINITIKNISNGPYFLKITNSLGEVLKQQFEKL